MQRLWPIYNKFRAVQALRKRKGRIALLGLHLVNTACILHLIMEHVGWFAFVDGYSMLPTMSVTGEIVLENILWYRLFPSSLKRGDLVTLRSPLDPARIICKRVLGLPGDVVCVDPTGLKAPSTEHVLVPRGHIWLIGDNAALARDSRDYGPVSMALIRGKLVARIWPLNKFRIFRDPFTILE